MAAQLSPISSPSVLGFFSIRDFPPVVHSSPISGRDLHLVRAVGLRHIEGGIIRAWGNYITSGMCVCA